MSRTARAIPPLVSGGVMLTYRCTNKCRHCLYRCSPKRPDDWMSLTTAERVFAALAREPRLHSIHLAGGEATIRFDLLEEVVRLATDTGLPLAYLETNAHWCEDRTETREKLRALRAAGLPAVLVSASMFHNEFVPFDRTRNCVEAATEVFGAGGVIVWQPHLYKALSRMPGPGRTHSLPRFCEEFGIPMWDSSLPSLYGVIAGGRAPEALRRCYEARPANAFRRERCEGEIFSTTHFHIDPHGNLFTGLCAGLAAGDLDDLHPTITEDAFPILYRLAEGGPAALARWAEAEHGITPDRDTFASKCDLCHQVRRKLHEHVGGFRELRPDDYYRGS